MISEAVVKVPFSQPLPRPQLAGAERGAPSPQFDCFIGVSAHLTELKEFISAQAAAHQPVLLIGERGLRQEQIAEEAMRMLVEYVWERNIDELESVIESMLVHAPPPRIDEHLLPDRIRYSSLRTIQPSGIDLPTVVGDYERSLIETALRQTGGNQTKAGRLLGLRVQTLNMKLKRFAELNKPIIISSEED